MRNSRVWNKIRRSCYKRLEKKERKKPPNLKDFNSSFVLLPTNQSHTESCHQIIDEQMVPSAQILRQTI